MLKKYIAFILLLAPGLVWAQQGIHGAFTVTAPGTIVNEYTALTGNIGSGATFIPVTSSTLNANGRFTGPLQPGDLILIYEVQGVWIKDQWSVANGADTTWGKIQSSADYWSCGRYEFRQVRSISSPTMIEIDCGTTHAYNAVGGAQRAQVIRVPRYTTLTVNAGGVLTCDDWNGSFGGVLAVEVQGNCVINGIVDANGRGFRGGSLVGDNVSSFGVNTTFSTSNTAGAEKGEGVAGYQADYTGPGGMYCRAPAANGGGGGDGHNAGGGGGANAPNSTSAGAVWSGNGVPDQSVAGWTTCWNREPPVNTMSLRTNANSAGGGRGGYTFSSNNQNAATTGPGNSGWGGDNRNHEATGLGGRPLDYSNGRLFLGGGGGAGDQNNGGGGIGGDGGGLIYFMVFGTVSGTGTINSNGTNGANGQGGTGAITGIDGGGGGGAGGTVVLNAIGGVAATLTVNTNGGNGGNQVINNPLFTNEAEGPGGGGGGGYIAVSSGTPVRNSNGGNNGTTNSQALTEFTPNGATRGCPGTNNAAITNFDISLTNQTICAGTSTSITATITGTPPGGYVVNWYNAAVGGAPIFTGPTYTTPVLAAGTYTYYAGTCAGWWREPVVITVVTAPGTPTMSSNSPVCSGNTLTLFSNTVAGATYSWTGPNGFTSSLEDPTIGSVTTAATGTYSLTITVGSCASPQGTIAVVVNPTPAAPTVGSNSPICAGQTLNLTSNTFAGGTYSWTGPNSFSSTLEDPSIVNATTAATGTYSLTVTVGGCTSAQSTTAVTVSNTPAPPTLSSNTPVCSGNALNLFANTVAGGTYSWTGPNSFTSAVEDPTIASATTAASGTYSLTITVGGCTSPQSTTSVTVNPTPAAPTVGSNSPLCAGQTLNLTSNTYAGGTYSWTGPNSFSSALEDPSIVNATTAATGTYSLTVTVGGCVSAQSTVAVIVGNTPGAPTLSSNTPVCTGNTLNLFANTVAGGTYSWTGPNGFTSSMEDPTIAGVTAAAAGTYSLTISIGGCTSPQSTTSVTVNTTPAAPTAGSNSPICSGQTLNLTSNTVAGATYSWTGPNSFTSSLEDPTIASATTAATGTYSVTITVNGCTSTPGTVAVVVNQTPSAPTLSSNSPVCSGNTLDLFANTVAGGTYAWTGPNAFSSAVEDPQITNVTTTASGTYSLTITENGCTSPQSTVAVVVNQTPASPGAASNSPVCAGSPLNLTSSTVPSATYSWTGPNSFTSSLEDPTVVNPATADSGMYYVSVTVNGCTSPIDSVLVDVNALPTVSAGSDVAICFGDSTTLNGTGTGTMAWINPAGLSCTNCAGPVANPATTTSYTFTITDANGCANSDSVIVTVNALPVAVAGSDVAYCAGDSTTLNGSGGGSYSWLPSTDLSDSTIANPVASPAATTTYVLEVSDINGCRDVDSVVVTVNALPLVSAGADASMCPAGNVALNATGAQTYAWSPAAGLSCTSCQNPIATPPATTTYFVVGTDSNGCVNNDTVVVTVSPNLVITASADQTICVGDSVSLTALGGSGTFVWTPGATLSNDSIQSPNAGPSTTTTYTVNVSDAFGCTGSDSVTVFVNPPIVPTVSGMATICIGDSATLSATSTGGDGNYSYTWNPGSMTGPSVTVSPTTTTQYTVDVSDGAGCTSQVTIPITVNPPLTLSAINPVAGCVGSTVNVTASGSGGDNNLVYTWMPGNLVGATQTITVSTTQTYTVILTDGCTTPADTQTVTITANPTPTVTVAADDSLGCSPLCVNFTGTSSASCVVSYWDFGNGDTSSASNPMYCFNIPGTYDVTYTCTDANGCVGTTTSTGLITVAAQPTASFSMSPGSPIQVDPSNPAQVCMTDMSTGAVSWSWGVDDGTNIQTSNQQNPCFTITDVGTYTVSLVATNAQGCQDTTILTFTAENPCGNLFVPNAFSPNGDGQNDSLFVYGGCIESIQFEIYSRWGEQVFFSAAPSNGWDGNWRGKACESGVFTYVLRGQLTDGTPIEQQGHINLIR